MIRVALKWAIIALLVWFLLVFADGLFSGLLSACLAITSDFLPADLDRAAGWFLFSLLIMGLYIGIYAGSLVAWLYRIRRAAWAVAAAAGIWATMILATSGDEWSVAGALAGALTFAIGADAARRALAISVTPVEFLHAWWELSNGVPFSSQAQLSKPIYSASNQFGSARLIRAKDFADAVEQHFERSFR